MRNSARGPLGDRADSFRRQTIERQLRDGSAGGKADEPREGLNGAAGLPRLRFEQAEHEIENDVVELIEMRERKRDVARRRGAGELQSTERQTEIRRAAAGRHFERQSDRAKMRLARNGRRRVDGDLAGERDDPAGAEKDWIVDGVVAASRLEQRQMETRRSNRDCATSA